MFSFRAESCWIALTNLGEDRSVPDRKLTNVSHLLQVVRVA